MNSSDSKPVEGPKKIAIVVPTTETQAKQDKQNNNEQDEGLPLEQLKIESDDQEDAQDILAMRGQGKRDSAIPQSPEDTPVRVSNEQIDTPIEKPNKQTQALSVPINGGDPRQLENSLVDRRENVIQMLLSKANNKPDLGDKDQREDGMPMEGQGKTVGILQSMDTKPPVANAQSPKGKPSSGPVKLIISRDRMAESLAEMMMQHAREAQARELAVLMHGKKPVQKIKTAEERMEQKRQEREDKRAAYEFYLAFKPKKKIISSLIKSRQTPKLSPNALRLVTSGNAKHLKHKRRTYYLYGGGAEDAPQFL